MGEGDSGPAGHLRVRGPRLRHHQGEAGPVPALLALFFPGVLSLARVWFVIKTSLYLVVLCSCLFLSFLRSPSR